jgi:hypothetical protein
MSVTAREYITLGATGDDLADHDLIRAVQRDIAELYGDRVAYQILQLTSRDDIEDELRDPDPILEVSGNVLPVILVNVTYVTGTISAAELAPLESRFGLRLVYELLDDQK